MTEEEQTEGHKIPYWVLSKVSAFGAASSAVLGALVRFLTNPHEDLANIASYFFELFIVLFLLMNLIFVVTYALALRFGPKDRD